MRALRLRGVSVLIMTDASTETDFWHVQLLSGEVRYWSLEELDEAFQRDEVDAKTYVLKEGDTTWQRLGELLGLDEVPPDLVKVPVQPYSIAPIPPSMPPPSVPAPSSVAPASFGMDTAGAISIRPVVSDLDDDDLMAAMKPKRKNLGMVAGGVALAAAVLIGVVTHASSGSDDKSAAAAAPPPVAAAAPAPPPAASDDGVARQVLSDDVKRQLIEADKAREAKAAAKAAENAKYRTNVGSYRAPKSGQVFHKGGNQYDPLSSGN